MKLLIIDDEKITREGIMNSVNWKSLHIQEVLQADDGVKGLSLAKMHRPEIILSDIRMPRMDGIIMAEKIHAILPNTCIIFMSGYSDKEYLKAAIKLKAIRYVEKPIDISEIEDAVKEAVKVIETVRHNKNSELFAHNETRRQLALAVLQRNQQEAGLLSSAQSSLQIDWEKQTYFTTFLLQFKAPVSEMDVSLFNDFTKQFSDYIASIHMHEFHAAKNDHVIVYHIYSSFMPEEAALLRLYNQVRDYFNLHCLFFIAPGFTVSGLEHIYESYNAAVILLQNSFFNEYNVVLTERNRQTDSTLLKDELSQFAEALSAKNADAARRYTDKLYESLKNSCGLLPSQVKDIYYKYLYQLEACMARNQLSPSDGMEASNFWDTVSACSTLHELDVLLKDALTHLFLQLSQAPEENHIIYMVKDFIRKNYASESLSVKEISEQVYLTTSYLCTHFKNETGKTINQYITEYRLEIAKQMLHDPRYKITDISSRVGYPDGNYFGKLFKKMTGLSPSEYREKVLE